MTRGTTFGVGTRGVSDGARLPAAWPVSKTRSRRRSGSAHKGQAAVPAGADLGLVGIDEDARVSGGASAGAAVADDDALVRPAHRLLVDQLHCRVRLRLSGADGQRFAHRGAAARGSPAWRSKSVCSNLGPDMASARGRWLRAHTPARFGACSASVGCPTGSVVCGTVSGRDVVTAAESNWRAVETKERCVRRRCEGTARAARNTEADMVADGVSLTLRGGVPPFAKR